MTFEKFEKAKEKYEEYDKMRNLACFFVTDEFGATKDMKIGIYGKVFEKDGEIVNTVIIPNAIREKIEEMLWDEVHKLEDEFEEI